MFHLYVSQNPFNLGKETHVCHSVGFVNNDALDQGHIHCFSFDQVNETARGRNDDVDSIVDRLNLSIDIRAAVYRDGTQLTGFSKWFNHACYLIRQFPGRGKHQSSGLAILIALRVRYCGQTESKCFA